MTDLLLPPGRMVAGSMGKPNTTDWQGNPLITKTGANQGQPRIEYFFAVAIAKGQEQHWSQTEWGQVIFGVANAAFPGGEAQRPDFAWKITDGDSAVPNKSGKTPNSKEGYPGHWVIGFSSGFEPKLFTADGSQQLPIVAGQPDPINAGDYIQVFCNIAGNNNLGNPGVYINHSMVALVGYGERISSGPDATSVGFGNAPVPAGASATPLSGGFNPAAPVQQPLAGAPAGVPQGAVAHGGVGTPMPAQQPVSPVAAPAQQATPAQTVAPAPVAPVAPVAAPVAPVAPVAAPVAPVAPVAAPAQQPVAPVAAPAQQPVAPVAAPVAGNYLG